MEGEYETEPLTIDGEDFGTIAAGGEATALLRRAESYATTILRRAESEHRTFIVKLEQMRDDPATFFSREITGALSDVFDSTGTFIRTFALSDLDSLELLINDDPEIARRLERQRNEAQRDEAIERREQELRN